METQAVLSSYFGALLGLVVGVFLSLVLAVGAEILGESMHYHDAGHGGAFPVLACATFLILAPILGILGGSLGFRMGKPSADPPDR